MIRESVDLIFMSAKVNQLLTSYQARGQKDHVRTQNIVQKAGFNMGQDEKCSTVPGTKMVIHERNLKKQADTKRQEIQNKTE